MDKTIVAVVAALMTATAASSASAQSNPPSSAPSNKSPAETSAGSSAPTEAGQKSKGRGKKGADESGATIGHDATKGEGAISTIEPRKHLVAVDVYLRNAINNSKVLYETSRMAPTRADSTLEKEEISNIERSLALAQSHLGHLKAIPESQRAADKQHLEQLQGDLTQATSLVGTLRRTLTTPDRTQLTATTGRLYSTLRMADEHFGQIADAENLTRVDRIEVPERQPVGGGPAGSNTGAGGD